MVGQRTTFLDWGLDGPVDVAQPRVVAANPLSSSAIEIGFSEPMKSNAALVDASNYSMDDPRILILSVVKFGDYKVRLNLGELKDLTKYTVAVANVEDRNGNVIDLSANSASFIGAGSLPELTTVQVVNSRKLRFNFSEPMTLDSELLDVFNYSVVPLAGGTPVSIGSITPENKPFPTFVDVDITEMTNAESYQGMVVNASDVAGNVIGGVNTFNFSGEGEPPVVRGLEAISQNRVDIIFDEPILDNAFARDIANYVWTGGLVTISILDVTGDRVKLVTSDQTPGTLYDLVIG